MLLPGNHHVSFLSSKPRRLAFRDYGCFLDTPFTTSYLYSLTIDKIAERRVIIVKINWGYMKKR